MKKLILALGVISMFGMTSCVKRSTCNCQYTAYGSNYTDSSSLGMVTKSTAESKCETERSNLEYEGYTNVNCSVSR